MAQIRRNIEFVVRISKKLSALNIDDFPTALRQRIKPPPLAGTEMNKLAQKLALPEGSGPAFVVLLNDQEASRVMLEFIKAKELPIDSFDIQVSIVTQWDHDGVELPDHVLELARMVQCGVGFSFIYTSAKKRA